MENENKNSGANINSNSGASKGQKGNSHRRRPHKPKAYYITPESDKPATEHNKSGEGAQQRPQADAAEKKQNGNQGHNRPVGEARPHRHEPQKQQSTQNSKSNQQQQNHTKVEAASDINASKSSNRNHHRRGKHHSQKPNQVQAHTENTVSLQNSAEDTLELKLMDTVTNRSFKQDKLEQPQKKLEKFANSPEYAKYSDYEEFTLEELYGENEPTDKVPNSAAAVEAELPDEGDVATDEEPMVEVVGIKFKASGKTYYFEPCDISLKVGSYAIVKTARGLEYGEVALANTLVKESETVPPLRPVVRQATPDDVKRHEENKRREEDAFRVCNEKIIAHELDMKLIDAQYTFDNSKLLFYFTSSGRVDFRDLVKDLASVFRTRIELRQIGIRDEAKMVGGLGLCGRPLCCSLFLSDFGQVSIKMAKDQNLSLNSSKISGICGRLMCCLRYEYEAYEYEIKRTPPVDSLVRTVDGVGVVTEISPLSGTIKVKLHDPGDAPPKTYKRDDVTVLKKKNEAN